MSALDCIFPTGKFDILNCILPAGKYDILDCIRLQGASDKLLHLRSRGRSHFSDASQRKREDNSAGSSSRTIPSFDALTPLHAGVLESSDSKSRLDKNNATHEVETMALHLVFDRKETIDRILHKGVLRYGPTEPRTVDSTAMGTSYCSRFVLIRS
ncbi:hypothetical protein TNCV_3910361 [Trichonephila clavipes]|nr:hypothetical protein TNCV_3910361 [Trichonephila clavipes]